MTNDRFFVFVIVLAVGVGLALLFLPGWYRHRGRVVGADFYTEAA